MLNKNASIQSWSIYDVFKTCIQRRTYDLKSDFKIWNACVCIFFGSADMGPVTQNVNALICRATASIDEYSM